MPIYQYKCNNCGANIEKMQSFSADPLVDCPECRQPSLKRVLQPAGIIFKGSGWYITDSKKSSSATVKSGDSDGSNASESKPAESSSPAAASTPAAPAPSE